MANKRNEPKPGSSFRERKGTFRDMCFSSQKPQICDSNGNTDKAQLPMKQRAANVLKLIKKQPGGMMMAHRLNKKVLAKLVKDGDVYIENGKSGHMRQSHSYARATGYRQPVVEEVVEEEEPKVAKKKIKWTKKKDQKLLIDIMMGTADPELVKEVGRTKTKFRKIAK